MKMPNCKNCDFFRIIYRHRFYGFDYSIKYPLYYCTYYEQMVKCESSCDNWKKKKKKEYDISPERFDEAEEAIEKLIEILG